MLVPDIAYRYLYRIDTASPTLEIVSRELSASAAALTVTVALTGVPANKILVVSNLTASCNPGAGLACTFIQMAGFTAAGARYLIHQSNFVTTVDVIQEANWQGEVWSPGRGEGVSSIEITGVFNSLAAANAVTIGLFGIIIPRGNTAAF